MLVMGKDILKRRPPLLLSMRRQNKQLAAFILAASVSCVFNSSRSKC